VVRGERGLLLFGIGAQQAAERPFGQKLRRQGIKTGDIQVPCRRFEDFEYRTRKSWSRARRVVGKAEILDKGENPRFVVTNLVDTRKSSWFEPLTQDPAPKLSSSRQEKPQEPALRH
jgi:Transposase DDE domain group 1